MALVLAGINHNTATIELREKVAFPPEIVGRAIDQLKEMERVEEVVIVSTCNRTELYLSLDNGSMPPGVDFNIHRQELVEFVARWIDEGAVN